MVKRQSARSEWAMSQWREASKELLGYLCGICAAHLTHKQPGEQCECLGEQLAAEALWLRGLRMKSYKSTV